MVDRTKPNDEFEQIQSDLYGVALTQEQLQDVYSDGTADGLETRSNRDTNASLEDSDGSLQESLQS